jgi:hypothetical protein
MSQAFDRGRGMAPKGAVRQVPSHVAPQYSSKLHAVFEDSPQIFAPPLLSPDFPRVGAGSVPTERAMSARGIPRTPL